MKISVLYYPHREGHNSVFPLLANKNQLAEIGIYLNFTHSSSALLSSKADVLLISGISLSKILKNSGLTTVDFLSKCKSKEKPLIYLAGSDSTGPFEHDIIRVVDLFLSRQLLKDKSFYLKSHKRHYFRDLYFSSHHFKNQDDFKSTVYTDVDVKKLGVFWNLGLIDWKTQTSSKFKRYYYIYSKNRHFQKYGPGKDLEERYLDLMFRGNLFNGNHDACRLHRIQTYRIYKGFKDKKYIPQEGLVSYDEYINEISKTKICLSPFGWGEICYRDFEAFQNRAILMKPDMGHVETYPDFYLPENYISYKWDGEDLKEKIDLVLDRLSDFQEVANSGYNYFMKCTSGQDAEISFSLHFKEILNNASMNFNDRASFSQNNLDT